MPLFRKILMIQFQENTQKDVEGWRGPIFQTLIKTIFAYQKKKKKWTIKCKYLAKSFL